MPVAAEIASMLDALDAPAMLIRPDDMTVAAVNGAFAQAYGRFRFEGKKCWEALHVRALVRSPVCRVRWRKPTKGA